MFFILALTLAIHAEGKNLIGFSSASTATELELEQRIDALIDPADQDLWMRKLTARPHHVGSPYGLENAKLLRELYESWGFQAQIETFDVLFPTPTERLLEMNGWRASLSEPEIAGDSGTRADGEALPLYNVYSHDGDVNAQLVYANYGLPEDYETLEGQGISVAGRIVLVRYGKAFRGSTAKIAAEHGALGCILYSDPLDDGYGQGDVYPKGPWRNASSGQRGSIADIATYPGDPLRSRTGVGSDRLSIPNAVTLPKIPVLPIGYGDAEPLLRDLAGPTASESWRGGLPLAYHVGPSAHPVHLKLKCKWGTAQVRDVIAKLPGRDFPGEWILRGNHHDAWVLGANDPISGQVAMLSEAKAIGNMAKDGWRPRRTIVFCSWDGEEPGLLGSTEWAEAHAEELSEKAVAYINSDSNSRGFLNLGGSHSLQKFANEVMRDVVDPETHRSLQDRARAVRLVAATAPGRDNLRGQDLNIGALGSGSDFSPFLQHLGIASIDLGFGGEGEGCQYHSAYDSYAWFAKFGDPNFLYGGTLARTGARLVARLANADELPFEYCALARTVKAYIADLTVLIATMRSDTAEKNRLIRDGEYAMVMDPNHRIKCPSIAKEVPIVDLSILENAVKRLCAASERYRLGPQDSKVAMQSERQLLGPGLPRRPWYRHSLYAPGVTTGYEVKTLPGVREAIEQRRWGEAEEQAKLAADALDRLSRLLENASSTSDRG